MIEAFEYFCESTRSPLSLLCGLIVGGVLAYLQFRYGLQLRNLGMVVTGEDVMRGAALVVVTGFCFGDLVASMLLLLAKVCERKNRR